MKNLNVVLVSLLLTFGVGAQENDQKKSPEEKAKVMTERLAEEVGLNETQKIEIEKINAQYISDMKAIKADESKDEDQKREAFKELRQNHKTQVEAQLTEEQKAKLSAAREERKDAPKLTPEEKAAKKTEKMKAELGLSEEQAAKIGDLNQTVALKIAAIKNDESMTPERKKQFIQGNKKDYQKALKTILTQDQMKKYEELKKKHDHHENHEDHN